jgi:Carboxypeptidase regulatory-like domain
MRARTVMLLCVAALMGAVASVASCRQGAPVFDPGERPSVTDGTISGTVRGPEGTSSIIGRQVDVINVETGERQTTKTNNAGGFTFKVKPGKYRVEVAILSGESILKQPGVMHVNRSDVDAHADFIIGSGKAGRQRGPSNPTDGLGPPIA